MTSPTEATQRHRDARDWPRFGNIALVFLVPWTLLTVLWAIQWRLEIGPRDAVDWSRIFALSALNWYTSAVVSVPLALLAWYYRYEGRFRLRWAVLFAVAIAAAAFARFLIFIPLHNAFFASSYTLGPELRAGFIPQFIGLVTVVAVVLAARYWRDARDRAIRSARLEREVTEARLEALQRQLHPHFLFNTLHCVSTLMHRDVDEADEMLARLCDLLRLTLERPAGPEVSLGDELAILERYLGIMELRFPNQLHARVDVPAALRETRVPALILQPLVENIVRHGLVESAAIEVRITAKRNARSLELVISDDGRGLPEPSKFHFGTGLENTRRRIATLYGNEGGFHIADAVPNGTEVRISIPIERHAP